MAFDPSVISSIPDNSIDPVKAKGKGYTLASLIDEQQLGRLKLNQAQSEQADVGKIRDVLKNADISTFEGQTKAAEKALKINPKLGMELQRGFAQQQSAAYDKQTADLQLYSMQQDHIAGALDNVLAEADAVRKSGGTDAMVNATIMKSVLQAKENLQAQTLPNGQPVWNASLDKALAAGPLTYDRIKSLEAQSNKGQELLKQRLAERQQATREAQEVEREKHDRAMEETAAKRASATVDGGFSGKSGELMAALAERGVSLPAGFRSKAQQKAMLEGIIARNPQATPDEIAEKIKAGQIEFGAEKKETQIAAGIAGKIRYAEEEINRLVPLVKDASAKVPRGKFVPWNRLKLYGESQISDPQLKKLKAYMTTLANAYDVLAARGGTDIEKRKHNREMFDSADSPQALQAAMDAVLTEARVSGEAAAASTKPRGAAEPPVAAPAEKVVDWSTLK